MRGEELDAAEITDRGLLGDRAYALMDPASGKVVSAKNPRKWPHLFDFQASLAETPRAGEKIPPAQITLPDGTVLSSEQDDIEERISGLLGGAVTLETLPPQEPCLEEYWPDLEDLDHRDTVTNESIPSGGFFDGAAVHLLTTATIDRLQKAYPQGRFEIQRFRPNIVVEPGPSEEGFVENAWIGRTLAIGEEVRLSIDRPCPRCVMTTLAQGELPHDLGILRTAAQQNQANVGVYVNVLQGGTIRRGDPVRVE